MLLTPQRLSIQFNSIQCHRCAIKFDVSFLSHGRLYYSELISVRISLAWTGSTGDKFVAGKLYYAPSIKHQRGDYDLKCAIGRGQLE